MAGKPNKGHSPEKKSKKGDNSSDDMDEEDEEEDDDDDNGGNGNSNSAVQTLKPKLAHSSKHTLATLEPGKNNILAYEDTNRGFYVPKLAGFEYLEGPELLQKAAKELKDL
jgi:hypothetical protein